jgi:hypothetical protein
LKHVVSHPARHAVHRRQRENQPRQPSHRPEGRQACDGTWRAAHRHSIGGVPIGLNPGRGSIATRPKRPRFVRHRVNYWV